MHILHTDRAILLELILYTRVVILKRDIQATLTVLAVEKVVSAAHPTDAALVAVEDLLFLKIIVKQIANATEITCKLNSTVLAVFLGLLDGFAVQALNLLHLVSVNLMVFLKVVFTVILYFIMAHTAGKKFLAYRAPLLAATLVVLAAKLFVVFRFFNPLFRLILEHRV